MTNAKWLAILCAGTLLAGCATQGLSTVPSAGGFSSPQTHLREGRLVLRIKVPKVRHARAGRNPQYVSLATQSMSVAISGPTKVTQTANLTSTSKGCTSTLTSTLCQLTIALKPGNYTATISTFDAVNGGGNKLSTAQAVAFPVKAGSSNAIGLTLSGIPHSVLVVPGSAYSHTAAGGEIELFGSAANKLLVEALDADGNAIVGPGSPSFVVSKAFGNLAIALAQPSPAQPNFFSVTPPSAFSGQTATLSVQAVYNSGLTDGCAQPGANCFGNAKVAMEQVEAAAQGAGFSVFESTDAAPFATVNGLTGANAVAFDSAANLYVLSASGIGVYAPPYTTLSYTLTAGMNRPRALTFDGNGDLFVANCPTCVASSGDSVTEYAAPVSSTSTPSATITTGISGPVALIEDASNDLFVANSTGNSVTEYAAGTTTPAATVTNTVAAPNALAIDTGAGLLFVSNAGGTVEQYSSPFNGAAPSGAVPATSPGGGTCPAGGTPTVNKPAAVVVVPAQNRLYVASSSLGTVNAVFAVRETALTQCRGLFDAGSNPTALAVDGTPNLYVANNALNTVTLYNPIAANPPTLFSTLSLATPVGLAFSQ
jgi:hypothetical protein